MRIDDLNERLAALEAEHSRLMQFVGVRLGTFARLRYVERLIRSTKKSIEKEKAAHVKLENSL